MLSILAYTFKNPFALNHTDAIKNPTDWAGTVYNSTEKQKAA